ncbi:Trk system potassium transport protein TrkA, partial [Archaeoglobales archaeon ex4484_92]
MRIIIAGAGEVGCGLAQALADKYDVFVIEKDLGRCNSLLNLDVVAIPGNAANLDTLKAARIENADIFLAVTGNDEVNLLAGLAAKKLGAKKVIVRVENPEYVDRPIIKDHPLGYDVLICPQLALAQEAARLVGLPGAIEIVSFSGGKVEMVEVQIMEGSKADGCRIKNLDLPKNIVITSIYRSGNLIIPRGETLLEKGDKIAIVGKSEEIERIRGLFGPPIVRRVTIFGAGTIGSYVAKILERSRISVKLVES